MLATGEVDVLGGQEWNLASDVREPTTGLGFSFSEPYFYRPNLEVNSWSFEMPDNLCIATLQDDSDWASFVHWIVAGAIYAEQEGISSLESNSMPTTNYYWPAFTRMFRGAVLESGNYHEIYSRNLNLSRTGRNQLYSGDWFGPHHYPVPRL